MIARQHEAVARDASASEVAEVRQQSTAFYDERLRQADTHLRNNVRSQAERLEERLRRVEQSADRRM